MEVSLRLLGTWYQKYPINGKRIGNGDGLDNPHVLNFLKVVVAIAVVLH